MANLFDSPWKIMIVAVVIIVMFGSRKLPDAARSLGKSMRILKTEVTSMHDDESAAPAAPAAASFPSAAQIQASQAGQPTDAQAQIDALQRQLSDLQQSVAKTSAPADAQQAK
jgi:sec-independent protein translocase protein TatA